MTIRVMVVDHHPIVRIGLRRFFDEHGGISVVAQGAYTGALAGVIRRAEVDVVVLDLALDDPSGVDALLAIRRRAPVLPVLIFGALPLDCYAETLRRMGASAYLGKTAGPAEIVGAIRRLYEALPPAPASSRDASPAPPAVEAPRHSSLTSREFQIFLHLARGESNAAVAHAVSLSTGTVSTYRSRLIKKLGLGSNSALTRYAIDEGLI